MQPQQLSTYHQRRSNRSDHFCTSEVAALCLMLADEPHTPEVLEAYPAVFSHHQLQTKPGKRCEHYQRSSTDAVAQKQWHDTKMSPWLQVNFVESGSRCH